MSTVGSVDLHHRCELVAYVLNFLRLALFLLSPDFDGIPFRTQRIV